MDAVFVKERITQLRLQKGVSEYRMSYDLGHSRSYIYNISSGKSLPRLDDLFLICEYFEITPVEFFDRHITNPQLLLKTSERLKTLSERDLEMILRLVDRLNE